MSLIRKLWPSFWLKKTTRREKSDSAPDWVDFSPEAKQTLFVPVLLPVSDLEFCIWLLPQVTIADGDTEEKHRNGLRARRDQADCYARMVEAYNTMASLASYQEPEGTAGNAPPTQPV